MHDLGGFGVIDNPCRTDRRPVGNNRCHHIGVGEHDASVQDRDRIHACGFQTYLFTCLPQRGVYRRSIPWLGEPAGEGDLPCASAHVIRSPQQEHTGIIGQLVAAG